MHDFTVRANMSFSRATPRAMSGKMFKQDAFNKIRYMSVSLQQEKRSLSAKLKWQQ
jgi:hypothetical protein